MTKFARGVITSPGSRQSGFRGWQGHIEAKKALVELLGMDADGYNADADPHMWHVMRGVGGYLLHTHDGSVAFLPDGDTSYQVFREGAITAEEVVEEVKVEVNSKRKAEAETFRRHLQSTIDLRTPLIREAEESIKECKDVLNAFDVLHQHGLPFPISWRDAYVDLLRKGKKQRKLLSEKQIMDKKLMKWVCKQAA